MKQHRPTSDHLPTVEACISLYQVQDNTACMTAENRRVWLQ